MLNLVCYTCDQPTCRGFGQEASTVPAKLNLVVANDQKQVGGSKSQINLAIEKNIFFLLGKMPKTCCGGYHLSRSLRPRIGPLPFLVLHCSKSHHIIKSSVLFPSIATIWMTKSANKFNHSTIFCMMPVPTISQSFIIGRTIYVQIFKGSTL